MLTDPVADLLVRIKNASMVLKPEIKVPFSKEKEAVAKILLQEGYLENIEVKKDKDKKSPKKDLVLKIKYLRGKPVIQGIKRISKPGLRIYLSYKKFPRVLSGFGMGIISTSKGVMTYRQARKKKLGGEIICQVW
ncbi:30S ribosomal protein S8 [Candidatus Beckwithbacteria bacterium CG10_big_fil_rev_8_21_14_0_10_34_10]|uniref:Small ribosomal subunit protein uS8 n=1 Tax=Candidatus Beckwithbacteria bacterium CG10_big_fil_rev_8_21_14_0_10_34_10 TaxID=1974495 RepID=A0A2H0W9X9_9BACT|nr:MAG: 30S ribosomal protein S8 [Candidatus Beckwithbacteria bacterium CG10_big_fil_rev_8_21_14_0_10_34_10]